MTQNWNDFLAQRGFRNDDADFGDAAAELAAARDATVVVPLSDIGLIQASGDDAALFLHNLLTNDVKGISPDDARLAGLCSAKGRLLATTVIWRSGDDYVLSLSADLLAGILKKLSMFILRSKLKLMDVGGTCVLLGLAGKDAAAALVELGVAPLDDLKTAAFDGGKAIALGNRRYLLALDPTRAPTVWGSLATHAKPAGLAAWHWLEIAAGAPRIVAATQEAFVPQMVNLEVVGGVSFTKGCYPGQEIVARTRYLGKIKRRMFRARLDVAARAGAHLYSAEAGDQSCGEVVMAAPAPGGGHECLAVIQTSCADSGDVRLGTVDGPQLHLLELPYTLP